MKNKRFFASNAAFVRGLGCFCSSAAFRLPGGKWLGCVFRLWLLPLLIPSLVFAAPATEAPDSMFPMAGLRLLIALGLVLGVFFLFYALSRKGFKLMPGTKSGVIKVVEMRSLGPKKALCLVEVRGEELLLGVGAERVELIAKMGPAVQKKSFDDEVRAHFEELK